MTIVADPSRPSHAHAGGDDTDAARITITGAALIIAVSVFVRLLINLNGFYLMDDYAFLARAGRPDALSLSVLLEPHLGHVMPAAHVLTWALQAVAPWEYAVPALAMAAGWLACLVLMYRLLTRWLGRVPVVLIPLAVYAVTPLTVQTTTWWAAAVNAIPLQLCALIGVSLLLPLARGASRLSWLRQAGVFACLLVALAFFSKSVLLPILFLGVAYAWVPGHGRVAIRRAFRAAAPLWIALALATAGYLAGYVTLLGDGRPRLGEFGPLQALGRSAQSITGALLPSWAGGPLDFTPGADPWGVPPTWVTGLAVAFLAGGIVLIVRGSSQTRRLAVMTAVYAAGCIFLLALGRQVFLEISSGALRYFTDLAVPATLLVAAVSRDVLGPRPTTRNAGRWIAAVVCAIAFIAMSLATTLRLADNAEAREMRAIALTALADLRAEQDGPILEQWIPYRLLIPIYGDYARSSWVFAAAPGAVRFAEQGSALRVWDDSGRLLPARVEGPVARREGPCPATGEVQQRLTLNGPVIPYAHVVEIEASSPAASRVRVAVGGGPAEMWDLPAGMSTSYRIQIAGGSTEVVIDSETQGVSACVTTVRVGAAVAIDGAP